MSGGEEQPAKPSLYQRIKQFAKDTVVAGTSTHGGVAGGIGARSRKTRPKKRD